MKISKFGIPTKPHKASSPKKSPKPSRINVTVPIQKSIRFFIMMLPAFFALAKPVSTIAKPACIQNTSAAPAKNHRPNISSFTAFKISSIRHSSLFIFHAFSWFLVSDEIYRRHALATLERSGTKCLNPEKHINSLRSLYVFQS